jgi:THO complex subunit 4
LELQSNAANSQPKSQPKSAAATKSSAAAAGTRGKSTRGRGRTGRSARPARKTAEELDSEMADYFETGVNAAGAEAAVGGVAAATNGDAAMDDEIMVSYTAQIYSEVC